MVDYIKICNSALTPTEIIIKCNNLTISGRKNIKNDPNANGLDKVEVQTQSFNNPIYSVSGINFTGEIGTLTMSHLWQLLKLKYDGTNPILLSGTYGNGTKLIGINAELEIPVIMDSFNFNISTRDTLNGYMPSGNITFIETK